VERKNLRKRGNTVSDAKSNRVIFRFFLVIYLVHQFGGLIWWQNQSDKISLLLTVITSLLSIGALITWQFREDKQIPGSIIHTLFLVAFLGVVAEVIRKFIMYGMDPDLIGAIGVYSIFRLPVLLALYFLWKDVITSKN